MLNEEPARVESLGFLFHLSYIGLPDHLMTFHEF